MRTRTFTLSREFRCRDSIVGVSADGLEDPTCSYLTLGVVRFLLAGISQYSRTDPVFPLTLCSSSPVTYRQK